MPHAVAGVSKIPGLRRGAKGRPIEIDRGREWLRPESHASHRCVDLCPAGDEAVPIDELTREFGEPIALAITVKDRAEDVPKTATAVCGRAAYPVPQADVHHAAL